MASSLPIAIKSDFGKPTSVLVEQVIDQSTKQGLACGTPGWDWDGQGNVIIRSLPNLSTGTYTVTFRLIFG